MVVNPGGARILHVTENLPGGIATYLNETLPCQGDHYGRDQVVLLAPKEQLDNLTVSARSAVTVHGYHRRGRNMLSLYRLARAFQQVLKQYQPTLVHAHSSFAGTICRLPGLKPNLPLVYCAHGWAFVRDDGALLRKTYVLLERLLQHRANAIIAISRHEKMLAEEAGMDPEHIQVIHYGLQDVTQSPRLNNFMEDGVLRLLFIGRLDRQKGLDWLLEVMADLPPERVQLTVVGAAVHSRQRANDTHLPNVHYAGWATPDQVVEHLNHTDALIMPSRWEGFGLTAIEAMRQGVPVLVSDRGALPEVTGNGEAGLVFSLDAPGALQEKLLALKAEYLQRMGRSGRELFSQRYLKDRMNRETMAVYRQFGF